MPIVVKSWFETRWSARTKTVKPVNKYLEEIFHILQDMIKMMMKMKHEVTRLYNYMLSYDFFSNFARILEQSLH